MEALPAERGTTGLSRISRAGVGRMAPVGRRGWEWVVDPLALKRGTSVIRHEQDY